MPRARKKPEQKISEEKIDEALKKTFPASDTPSFVGAQALSPSAA